MHARTGRRSRLVSSECKNKRTFKSNPMTGLGHSGNVYLLRHRQDSNLRGHCPFDILSYGLKPELSVKDDSTNIHSTKITYQNSTVDTICDRIIDQAPIKFTLDRNCAQSHQVTRIFTKESRRDHTKKPRADLRRVSTRRRERRHGCEYHVPARVTKPIPDSHRLPRLGSNQPAFEAHRFKQLHAKQIRPFVPSVNTG